MRILIQEFSFNRGSGSTSPSATQFYGMPDAGHTGTVPLVCCEDWSQKLCLLRLAVLMQFFKIKMFVQSTTFFIPAAYFCDIIWLAIYLSPRGRSASVAPSNVLCKYKTIQLYSNMGWVAAACEPPGHGRF